MEINRQDTSVVMLRQRLAHAERRIKILTREIRNIREQLRDVQQTPNAQSDRGHTTEAEEESLPVPQSQPANTATDATVAPVEKPAVVSSVSEWEPPASQLAGSSVGSAELLAVLLALRNADYPNTTGRNERLTPVQLSPGRRSNPYHRPARRSSSPVNFIQSTTSTSRESHNSEFIIDDGYTVVYANGFCQNNGRWNARAGLGVFFGKDHKLNMSQPVFGKPTSNTAEIQACTYAVNIAHRNGIKKLIIRTASDYMMNVMCVWIYKWKENNWKLQDGGHVKNKDLIVILDNACQLLEDVIWEFVEIRSSINGTDEADKLAKAGLMPYGY